LRIPAQSDREPRPLASVVEVYDQVAGGLRHPRCGRVSGRAEAADPAVCVLDHGHHVQSCSGQGGSFKNSQATTAPAGERRNWAQGWKRSRVRIDTGGPEDLPHGGCRDPQSDDEEFAVGAAVSPAGVVCGQAQDQGSVERMVRTSCTVRSRSGIRPMTASTGRSASR
jgi:hypothetical protein